ncbi:MAG: BspA family leucine-rich repeat surface protein [Bacteroidales bacterium]|nr:BspA family leucine-rich repeat surface protein [Bacteroidales bacterium]
MKRISILFAALATLTLGFVSCQKDETATLTFSAHTEADGAKTALNSEGYATWQNTDEVEIFGAMGHATFTVDPRNSDPTWAELTGDNIGEGPYTAIYPASMVTYTPNDIILPRVQTSTDGNLSNFPMMATANSTELQFTNLCSALRVRIPAGTPAVKMIEVEADQSICGNCTIGTGADGKPYAQIGSNESRYVTLMVDNPTSYNTDHYYYITLPAGTYHSLTLRVYDNQGRVGIKSLASENGVTLRRSQFVTLRFDAELEFQQVAYLVERGLSISSANKIIFHYNSNVTSNTTLHDRSTNSAPIYMVVEYNTPSTRTLHLHTPAPIIQAPVNSMMLFYHIENTTSIDFGDGFRTDYATDMNNMFVDCKSLLSLDLSTFNTENVTDMHYMFLRCEKLTSLDLSSFNTERVERMDAMFCKCKSLTNLDLSSFNTTNTEGMAFMFSECQVLETLDISNFNTANVTDMEDMFYYCKALTSLDLSHFNTANVTNMRYMFYWCENLTSLDISNFNTANVTDMSDMFYWCSYLPNLDLTSFSSNSLTNASNMFNSCHDMNNIYFNRQFNMPNGSCNGACYRLGSYIPNSPNGCTIHCNNATKTALETTTDSDSRIQFDILN